LSQTHIIGAGLAGLAAALDLAAAGRAVTLYESGPTCGGRCRSYFDRELNTRIDNGNHLLLSGNRDAMRYLTRIGTQDTLGGPATPLFPFIDIPSRRRWHVRPNLGPIPWWVFIPSRGVPGATLRDYASLLRLRSASPPDTVAGRLPRNQLYRNLIEPFAIAALNTPPEHGSARLLWAVMAESLARGGAHCIPRFPKLGLSESFVEPAVAHLAAAGATIHTSRRIAALQTNGTHATALLSPDGPIALDPTDQVILAVPAPVAAGLLPGLTVPDEFQAIFNLHFKYAAAPTEAGFIGLIGSLAEWIFIKPGIVSVTISAANRLADHAPEELARAIWPEICIALDIVADLPPWRAIREKRATFAATPAQQQRRISATTHLQNVTVSGDWTDTGLPATIEGAIRSGFVAAQKLLAPAN
jgi:squalene-associated FAD-dependent desaturase